MTSEMLPAAPYAHVCWVHDDPAPFHRQARAFLTAGLAAGERLWYVTAGPVDPVLARLSAAPALRDALARGVGEVVSLEGTYRSGAVVDGPEQVRAYAAATDAALAAGYRGLRVVAEATPLVRTPAQRDAFARYEHLVDRYMRGRPFSAMCGYDRRELGGAAAAELACLHPTTNAVEARFQLYACAPAEDRAGLAGELDPSSGELFATALERADLRPVDGRLVLEAPHLRFVDHHTLLLLRDYGRRRAATVTLRTPRAAAARLAALLNLSGLEVEVTR
ncbi:MEDS domain-containing protein [Micromonospora sp. WMMD812]|uniref:MEDS domain-containing protein n=1 Tax=Micromonospora sp. WMMD812 TaxID=3015152 RepID=UPI00248C5FFB|nr:MEDS domain-containing protein [Micromonospora sp. WMMD812]WBB65236.1 MEDS domain-containing protein [Micromonospora sp. WMMD812]